MAETNVQIEVPRTGSKIRNLSASVVQSDGTVATVLMQVVALANDRGELLDLDMRDTLQELLRVAQSQQRLLKVIAEAVSNTNDLSNLEG